MDCGREPSAAIVWVLGHGTPTGSYQLVPCLAERSGHGNHPVVHRAALKVTDPVDGGDYLGHEAAQFVEHPFDGVGIDVFVAWKVADALDVGNLTQHQANVVQWRRVVDHGLRLAPARRPA